jgi:hypothetical protein
MTVRLRFSSTRGVEAAGYDTGEKRAMRRTACRRPRPSEVARLAGINESTLRKALGRQGFPHLAETPATNDQKEIGSSKSERSRAGAEAAGGMGAACTRADERVAAAMGLVECATARFKAGHDVQMAGLLAGPPALCANGLLMGLGKHLHLPKGFYGAPHILLTLGFMALGRIRRSEGLRHLPPGELGKVIGLERAPEARTLREKFAVMAAAGNPGAWMKEKAMAALLQELTNLGFSHPETAARIISSLV